jgi:hypothetical protein
MLRWFIHSPIIRWQGRTLIGFRINQIWVPIYLLTVLEQHPLMTVCLNFFMHKCKSKYLPPGILIRTKWAETQSKPKSNFYIPIYGCTRCLQEMNETRKWDSLKQEKWGSHGYMKFTNLVKLTIWPLTYFSSIVHLPCVWQHQSILEHSPCET